MDYISLLKDSIYTSVHLKIFKNRESSLKAHIFGSKLIKIPLKTFNSVYNFDPNRLQLTAEDAYPLPRPRGDKDISSVKFYQTQIQQKQDITPIWIIQQNNKYMS